ncbi:hypothetical protein B0H10DRAFT_1956199 [Mycena sp. CBHHK59/15]|nr:hypothetical protein B0H10DRAFT_1956199 [Mycena sp. CBHHK59/15]
MATASRCGEPLPLRADFNYDVPCRHCAPAEYVSERAKQTQYPHGKRKQREYRFTCAYQQAALSSTIPAGLDVGPLLHSFFAYSQRNLKMLVFSKEFVDSVAPLPMYLVDHIVEERFAKAEADSAEKEKREKEHLTKEAEKAKANHSIIGTLTMKHPHTISPSLKSPIIIPKVYLMSVHHGLTLPLHWWSDDVLRDAAENPTAIPTNPIKAEQTSELVKPEKINAVHMVKAEKLLGAEKAGVISVHLDSGHTLRSCSGSAHAPVTPVASGSFRSTSLPLACPAIRSERVFT